MDFNATVKKEMEGKYREMLAGTTKKPFDRSVATHSHSAYDSNRKRYYDRLKQEKEQFNSALAAAKSNFRRRMDREYDGKNNAAKRSYCLRLALAIIACLLPVVAAALIGFDVFYPAHMRLDYVDALGIMPSWSVVFVYVLFCILALGLMIGGYVRMSGDEGYSSIPRDDEFSSSYYLYDKHGKKITSHKLETSTKVIASICAIIFGVLAVSNVALIILGYNTIGVKVTYESNRSFYLPIDEKGKEVVLNQDIFGEETWDILADGYATYEGEDGANDGGIYTIYGKWSYYTFVGWEADGKEYQIDDSIKFEKSTLVKARYDVENYYKLKIYYICPSGWEGNLLHVYADGEAVKVDYESTNVEHNGGYRIYYIKEGSEVTIKFDGGYFVSGSVFDVDRNETEVDFGQEAYESFSYVIDDYNECLYYRIIAA